MVSSVSVSVVEYGVLGTQLMHGPSVNRGDWFRRQACEPDSLIAIIDPAGLPFIQKTGPSKACGASGAIYKWLGIQKWKSYPTQVKYAIKAETQAKLHVYVREGYQNNGPVSVIHVASPDFRSCSGIKREEAMGALAKAYCKVFKEFNCSGPKRFRLLPISGGTFSGRFQSELPALIAVAIHAANRSLPMPVQATLKAATFEMCIYDEDEYQSYTNAFEKLAIGMPKKRTDVVETTNVVANYADIRKEAPALSPNDVVGSSSVTKPILAGTVRKRNYARLTTHTIV